MKHQRLSCFKGAIIKPFKNQVWENLRSRYNKNNLFEDPEFPATSRSLFVSKSPPTNIRWKRPTVRPSHHSDTHLI